MSGDYLRRVGARFVFRRRVPAALRTQLGRRELVRSIGLCNYREAQRRARMMSVAVDALFVAMQNSRKLTPETVDRLVRDWFNAITDSNERRLNVVRPDNHDNDIQLARDAAEQEIAGVGAMLAEGQWMAASEIADSLIAEAGIHEGESGPTYVDLCRKIQRAIVAAAKLQLAHIAGDYSATVADSFFAVSEAAEKAVGPSRHQRKKPSAPLFSEIVRNYVAEKMRHRAWRAQTEHQNRKTFGLFVELLGDRPINEYDRKDMSRFSQTIQKLPAKYGQARAFKGKSIVQLIALTDKPESRIALVTSRTVQRHMIALTGLFGWAKNQGYVEGDNPVGGVFKHKRGRRAREERSAWKIDKLRLLFGLPLWRGARTKTRRSEPGKIVDKDAMYWAPLIAVYTGARLEEICSLRVKDIQEADSVTFFNISAEGGKLLKSRAAVRRVPVHRKLVALGFLDHVADQRRRGRERLFHELKPGGRDGRYGFSVTRRFGFLRVKNGIIGVDFHGFRHTAITAMRHAGVSDSMIRELVGHEGPGGETDRYSKGYSLDQLAEAINRVEYPGLDLSALYPAMLNAPDSVSAATSPIGQRDD